MLTALLRHWRTGASLMLLAGLAAALLAVNVESRRAERWKRTATEHQAALDRLEADYRVAAERARAEDATNMVRAERDQIAASQETMDAYSKELDALRARHAALRVREAAAGTDPGGRTNTPMSGVPDAAGGPDDRAGEDRLPAEDALIASEQALRLKALQHWVRGQQSVVR